MEKKRSKFLGIYLILTLAFGVIGLLDSILSFFNFSSLVYLMVVGILSLFFLFFNIFALVYFMQNKLEKITLVLPLYHLIGAVIFSIIGYFASSIVVVWGSLGILTSLFEILFSLYLLKRFEFF